MNSLKKGEGVPLLNFEGGSGVLLLNFEGGPGSHFKTLGGSRVPLLNFEGGPGVPGSWSHLYSMPKSNAFDKLVHHSEPLDLTNSFQFSIIYKRQF